MPHSSVSQTQSLLATYDARRSPPAVEAYLTVVDYVFQEIMAAIGFSDMTGSDFYEKYTFNERITSLQGLHSVFAAALLVENANPSLPTGRLKQQYHSVIRQLEHIDVFARTVVTPAQASQILTEGHALRERLEKGDERQQWKQQSAAWRSGKDRVYRYANNNYKYLAVCFFNTILKEIAGPPYAVSLSSPSMTVIEAKHANTLLAQASGSTLEEQKERVVRFKNEMSEYKQHFENAIQALQDKIDHADETTPLLTASSDNTRLQQLKQGLRTTESCIQDCDRALMDDVDVIFLEDVLQDLGAQKEKCTMLLPVTVGERTASSSERSTPMAESPKKWTLWARAQDAESGARSTDTTPNKSNKPGLN